MGLTSDATGYPDQSLEPRPWFPGSPRSPCVSEPSAHGSALQMKQLTERSRCLLSGPVQGQLRPHRGDSNHACGLRAPEKHRGR